MPPATNVVKEVSWGGNMRSVTLLCTILLLSVLGFGQTVVRGYPGYCSYGCGPYVPLITTPELSFATVSPNPVGATNATGGLVAGATNSTLSQVSGNIDAVYTQPVWYVGGGTPLISPDVNAPIHEFGREWAAGYGDWMHRHHEAEQQREAWLYFSSAGLGPSPVQAARAMHGRAARTYSNEDVKRQNQQNGLVKYEGKTQKIQ
jgi:hypothetical protein